MGRLKLPNGSLAYLDAAPIIYSIEKKPKYHALMTDIWFEVETGNIGVVTSELTLLETLVHPVRDDDADLIKAYEAVFRANQMQLVPVNADLLRFAVDFRVVQNLKTPDAIHAATATLSDCSHFVTNDPGFRRLENIDVIILSDLL